MDQRGWGDLDDDIDAGVPKQKEKLRPKVDKGKQQAKEIWGEDDDFFDDM